MKLNKILSLFLLFFFFITTSLNVVASHPILNAKASVLVDAASGSVLYQENIDEQLGIASITKLMSVHVVMEGMAAKGIKLEDQYKMSKRAAALKSQSVDISGVWYTEGETVTIQDLLKLSLVYSDNSAIIQLAEIVNGSESEHVQKMNEQAAAWGLKSTHFVNVTGLTMVDYGNLQLPNVAINEYNKSTARELGSMAQKILAKHPDILEYTKQNSIEFRGEQLKSFNMMLPGLDEEYPGVVGLKTGTSDEAGYCFVGYYVYKDKPYISVVLNATSSNGRFVETKKLYNWIQGQLINVVIDKKTSFNFDLNGDLAFSIALVPGKDVLSISGSGLNSQISKITYNPEYFDKNNRLIKDIPAGSTVMTVTFEDLKEQEITTVDGDATSFVLPLVSEGEIKCQGKFLAIFGSGFDFIKGLYDSIISI